MWRREPAVAELIKDLNRYTEHKDWDRMSREERYDLLQKAEWDAVVEQQTACTEDFVWAARNYFWITDNDGGDVLLDLWHAQYLILQLWYDLKSRGKPQKIYVVKGRQIGACLDPETPVLTSDLRWIKIDDVTPGQELVAVDEESPGGRGKARKMRRARVVARNDVFEPAYRITLDNGKELIATAEHRFLCKNKFAYLSKKKRLSDKSPRHASVCWKHVGDMREGDKVRYVCGTWEDGGYEDGWMGGMLDGEGSLRGADNNQRGGAEICISQKQNNPFRRALQYLNERGYHYRIDCDARTSEDSSKYGTDPVSRICIERVPDVFRLLGQCRPSRFIERTWWDGMDLPGKRTAGKNENWGTVLSITPLGKRRMVDLQTTAGTFIANGFVSHNSILIEAMIAWATMFFPNTEALVVSVDENHSSYLFGLMLHIHDHLPWWLKPEVAEREEKYGIKFDRKDAEKRDREPGLNSKISVQYSTQVSGVGQGRKILAFHGCFSPNTIIRLADGRVKPIVEMRPGDRVITSSGRAASVKGLCQSPRTNELMAEIKLWGNPIPLSATRDHRILTPSGYRPAGELKAEGYVSVPIRPISQSKATFEVVNFGTGGHNKWTIEDRTKRAARSSFDLDYSWGWLFGLYLSEGSLVRNLRIQEALQFGSVVFSIHKKEEKAFAAKLKKSIPRDRTLKSRRATGYRASLAISWGGLARFIAKEFGYKDEKRIPEWVWSAGAGFCRGLVHGYLSGDGSLPPDEIRLKATSIRASLPVQIRDLCASLGYGWSAIQYREGGLHSGRNCQAAWILDISGDTAIRLREDMGNPCRARKEYPNGGHHWRFSGDRKFIEVEVDTVGDGFSEKVYDIEVDDPDHNFCTLQCCVANSETTDWFQPKARKIIEGDLLHAIKETPRAFAFLETTGKEAGSYSHKLWRRCERLAEMSEWYPLFLPWFFEPGRRRTVTVDWVPKKPELSMRERVRGEWVRCGAATCGRYMSAAIHGASRVGQACPFCQAGILGEVTLTDEQLYWKEIKRRNAQETDSESYKEHQIELATTAEESFQLQGLAVFDSLCQEAVTATIIDPDKTPGVKRGYFDHQKRFHGLDGSRPAADDDGRQSYRCYLDGCNVNHMADLEQFNVTIWEQPQDGAAYSIGVDIAEGIGQDYSVIFVNKFGRFGRPDEQVAVLRDNRMEPLDLAFYCVLMGMYYNEALLAIEYNGIGKVCADAVRHVYQYSNIYRWKHLDSTQVLSNKWHWYTKPDTREKLWQTARKWIKAGSWVIRSKNFLAEMEGFQKDEDDSKNAGHGEGEHDDELFAGFISLYCGHESEQDERGVIHCPMVETKVSIARFQMICLGCQEKHLESVAAGGPEIPYEWPADDPSLSCQCAYCYGTRVIGKPLETHDPRGRISEVDFGVDGILTLNTKGHTSSREFPALTLDQL